MNKRISSLTGLATIAAGLFLAMSQANGLGAIAPPAPPLQAYSESWREGDIIFRNGTGIEAAVVRTTDTSGFTHVGMLVMEEGHWFVIHAEPQSEDGPGGVIAEPVEVFASPAKATTVGVFSVVGASAAQRLAAAGYARAAAARRTPFDPAFRFSSDGDFYCTELAVKAYALSGVSIADWHFTLKSSWVDEPVLTPGALLQSGRLNRVS